MKIVLAATMVALLLPAVAQARTPRCDVSVQFGSYAAGIDSKAFQKVQRYAARRQLVFGSSVTAWGREGEKTICLTAKSRGSTGVIFADIKGLVGKGERGPTEVKTLDGRVWRVNPGAPR